MCRTRGFRHSCGHYITRCLSSCRGTYASPTSNTVLCNATPEITVSQSEHCSSCQYKDFYRGWEARIFEAQERQAAANQLLRDTIGTSAGYEESTLSQDEEDKQYEDDGLGFDDVQKFKEESKRATQDLEDLHHYFRREQRNKWRSHGTRTQSQGSQRGAQSQKPSQRVSGLSPLKIVTTTAELDNDDDDLEAPHTSRSSFSTSFSDSESSSDDSSPDTPHSWSPTTFGSGLECLGAGWLSVGESKACAVEEEIVLPDYSLA